MILAAGRGTRLGALTEHTPKALVEINGKPMLEHLLIKLIHAGYEEFIINVHHHAKQIIEYLQQKQYFGKRIEISDESAQLLDTGGGLQKASHFFDGKAPLLVHNVDIVTDLNLQHFLKAHIDSGAKASLAVRERETARNFVFDTNLHLKGWINKQTGECIPPSLRIEHSKHYAFSGIQILQPELLQTMNQRGAYSLTHWYLELMDHYDIRGYVHNEGYWNDVGKPAALEEANAYMQRISNNPEHT
jgi:NDP-sugar pyrophosphorylase family protein